MKAEWKEEAAEVAKRIVAPEAVEQATAPASFQPAESDGDDRGLFDPVRPQD